MFVKIEAIILKIALMGVNKIRKEPINVSYQCLTKTYIKVIGTLRTLSNTKNKAIKKALDRVVNRCL